MVAILIEQVVHRCCKVQLIFGEEGSTMTAIVNARANSSYLRMSSSVGKRAHSGERTIPRKL